MLAEEGLALASALRVVVLDSAADVLKPALIEPQPAFQQNHLTTRWEGERVGQPDTRSQAGTFHHGQRAAAHGVGAAGTSQGHEHCGGENHEPHGPKKGVVASGSVCYRDCGRLASREDAHPMMLLARPVAAAGIHP